MLGCRYGLLGNERSVYIEFANDVRHGSAVEGLDLKSSLVPFSLSDIGSFAMRPGAAGVPRIVVDAIKATNDSYRQLYPCPNYVEPTCNLKGSNYPDTKLSAQSHSSNKESVHTLWLATLDPWGMVMDFAPPAAFPEASDTATFHPSDP